MANTICELMWLSYLFSDLQLHLQLPIPLCCDNKSVMHITADPVFHEKTKHIKSNCHIARKKYKDGFILLQYISGHTQLADIFTKSLSSPQFSVTTSKLGLLDPHQTPT